MRSEAWYLLSLVPRVLFTYFTKKSLGTRLIFSSATLIAVISKCNTVDAALRTASAWLAHACLTMPCNHLLYQIIMNTYPPPPPTHTHIHTHTQAPLKYTGQRLRNKDDLHLLMYKSELPVCQASALNYHCVMYAIRARTSTLIVGGVAKYM